MTNNCNTHKQHIIKLNKQYSTHYRSKVLGQYFFFVGGGAVNTFIQ